jgi:hypothetical protein
MPAARAQRLTLSISLRECGAIARIDGVKDERGVRRSKDRSCDSVRDTSVECIARPYAPWSFNVPEWGWQVVYHAHDASNSAVGFCISLAMVTNNGALLSLNICHPSMRRADICTHA